MPERPPTVLILGGLQTLARPLTLYLSQPDSEGRAQACFVRIVDRFSVSPPSTYLDPPFVKLLADGGGGGADTTEPSGAEEDAEAGTGTQTGKHREGEAKGLAIEYKQANLSLAARHQEIFTPPSVWDGLERDWEQRGFEVVYDLTGEMGFDRPELVSSHSRPVEIVTWLFLPTAGTCRLQPGSESSAVEYHAASDPVRGMVSRMVSFPPAH